jgi:GT2 family glycosyltransferase
MKEALVVLCTPDMNRPTARRAIDRLKATDLARVEVYVLDNAWDRHFRHARTMQEMLVYAGGRPVIFLDDDVFVDDRAWVDKLFAAASATGASVTGCVHTFPGGEINHTGILVHTDGTTEMLRTFQAGDSDSAAFCPAVSSALVLVKDSSALAFDVQYEKYQHDVDICLRAWARDAAVVCARDLTVVHVQADYMASRPEFREVLARDVERFRHTWRTFAADRLYSRPELGAYRALAAGKNWECEYNAASRLKQGDPAAAVAAFQRLTIDCPMPWLRAGAFFQLFGLEQRPEHLRSCLALNPHHNKAAQLLRELAS